MLIVDIGFKIISVHVEMKIYLGVPTPENQISRDSDGPEREERILLDTDKISLETALKERNGPYSTY